MRLEGFFDDSIDDVMLADRLGNNHRYIVARFDPHHRVMIYLHGCNPLGQVSHMSEDMNLVAQL